MTKRHKLLVYFGYIAMVSGFISLLMPHESVYNRIASLFCVGVGLALAYQNEDGINDTDVYREITEEQIYDRIRILVHEDSEKKYQEINRLYDLIGRLRNNAEDKRMR